METRTMAGSPPAIRCRGEDVESICVAVRLPIVNLLDVILTYRSILLDLQDDFQRRSAIVHVSYSCYPPHLVSDSSS